MLNAGADNRSTQVLLGNRPWAGESSFEIPILDRIHTHFGRVARNNLDVIDVNIPCRLHVHVKQGAACVATGHDILPLRADLWSVGWHRTPVRYAIVVLFEVN